MAAMAVILDFTIVDFSFLCSTSHPDASYLVKVNKPFGSGKEAKNTFSRWPPDPYNTNAHTKFGENPFTA